MHLRLAALLALPCALLFMPACDDGGGSGDPAVQAVLDLEGDPASGGNLFANSCGSSGCHGADGDSGPAPNISGGAYSDRMVANAIVNGIDNMPAQSFLSDQEAADVIAYLSTL